MPIKRKIKESKMLYIEQEREQLKGKLRNYVDSITSKSKGASMYVCPLCGSGTGHNKTGAFSIQGDTKWKCFSCNKGGDIFDLIGEVENMTDHTEQLKRARELYGTTDVYRSPAQQKFKIEYQRHTQSSYTATQHMEGEDHTLFFLEANKNIKKTDYHRGISLETINRYKIGFDENWQHPKAPNSPKSPRLIIPTSKYSYLARDTRSEIPEKEKKYAKIKVGSLHFFNIEALKNATKPIFLVEGELDALSIIDVGGEAIALGTVVQKKSFIELVKAEKPKQPIIIALDNDGAGEKAAKELIEELININVSVYRYNPCGEFKDANEALQKNREVFAKSVVEAEHIQEKVNREQFEEFFKHFASNRLQNFINGIHDSVNTPYIPTGFKSLDEALDGGLHEGLYVIGAISSLGKTTFTLQMCDQIAKSGKKILIFSLEMSASELISKSISRHTLEIALADGIDTRNAKTNMGITTGSRYKYYNQEETNLIENAFEAYGKYANNICIYEGIGDIGSSQIRKKIEKFISFTVEKPVVLIDYVQILAPADVRATDKQNTDKSVLELKRTSRDYKIPVIGISSFNRANYKTPVTMEAFKESGALEYSSDVLMGLQLEGVGSENFDVNEAKSKDPREVELVILKNRNGATGEKLSFEYYPRFNYFKELANSNINSRNLFLGNAKKGL